MFVSGVIMITFGHELIIPVLAQAVQISFTYA